MKVNREEFLASLDRLKPALAKGGNIAETTHFWFDKKYAFAYDGALGIRIPLETDFAYGLPGTPLLALLKSTATPDVELAPGKRAGLDLLFGSGHATLTTLELARSPWAFPEPKAPQCSMSITEAVLDGLRRALLVKVAKPNRVMHYGVTLFPTDKGVALFTTDSKMMIRVLVDDLDKPLDEKGSRTVLPRAFAEQIIAQVEPGAVIEWLPNCLRVKGESVELFSNVLDSTGVHDLPAVVEKFQDVGQRTALPAGFGKALERAGILAGSGGDPFVQVIVGGEVMELSGKYKHGRLKEELPLTSKVEDAEIWLDANKLPGLNESTDFAMNKEVFVLYGGDDFIFFVTALDDE